MSSIKASDYKLPSLSCSTIEREKALILLDTSVVFSSLMSDLSTDSLAIDSLPFFDLLSLLDLSVTDRDSFGIQLALATPPSQGDHLVSPVVAKGT